jgi:hypothetical protein
MKITQYRIYNPLPISIPNKKRKWMDETHDAFAYRCLPLTVANGYGWTVNIPFSFSAIWNGGRNLSDISIKLNSNSPYNQHIVTSHFGSGVITFSLGFLIQTEENHNLYVKGPANNPKRGITALEGIVETDWLPFTFTMNWKITEENYEVKFEEGEPICTFFPIERGYLEQWKAESRSIKDNEELHSQYGQWANSRQQYNANLKTNGNKGQRDYLRGQYKNGTKFERHQNIIKASEFEYINSSPIEYEPCYDNCCLDPNK